MHSALRLCTEPRSQGCRSLFLGTTWTLLSEGLTKALWRDHRDSRTTISSDSDALVSSSRPLWPGTSKSSLGKQVNYGLPLPRRKTPGKLYFSFTRDLARSYGAHPDISLSTYSSPLADRLRTVGNEAHSDDALKDIWRDILESFGDGEPGLPVSGEDADRIWGELISLGARDEMVMHELCDYSEQLWARERRERSTFYAEVVAAFIKYQKYSMAIHYHEELFRKIDIGPFDLLKVLRDGCNKVEDLACFQKLYDALEDQHLYDDVVSHLCSNYRFEEAMIMHNFFMHRQDYPSNPETIKTLGIYVTSQGKDVLENFKRQLGEANFNISDSLFLFEPENDSQEWNDVKIASIFATLCPTSIIVDILAKSGITKLGPLSIQQLCLRSKTLKAVSQQLRILSEKGITLNDAVYNRLVERIVTEGDELLFAEAISNVKDPATLEDVGYYKKLLILQYKAGEWGKLHFTRTILSLNGILDAYVHNTILQEDLRPHGDRNRRQWRQAMQTLEIMDGKGIAISPSSLEFIRGGPLHRENIYAEQWGPALEFTTILCRSLQRSPTTVPTGFWHHVIDLLGFSGRLAELERLVVHLASENYFGRRSFVNESMSGDQRMTGMLGKDFRLNKLYKIPQNDKHLLFSAKMQQNLIKWGFRHQLNSPWVPGSQKLSRISRPMTPNGTGFGLYLLKKIRDENGVIVPDKLIKDSVLNRLRTMMNRDGFLSVPERWSLSMKLAADTNRIWDSALLPESEQMLADAIFGQGRQLHGWQVVLRQLPHLNILFSKRKDLRNKLRRGSLRTHKSSLEE